MIGNKMSTADIGAVTLMLILLSVSLGECGVINQNNNQGHGSDIDNPNVPKNSQLENILESEGVYVNGTVKEPKHLHKEDKDWQAEVDHDVHKQDSSENTGESDNTNRKRTFTKTVQLWPGNTIPYKVDSGSFSDVNTFMTTLNQAIDAFSQESCIEWKPWSENLATQLSHNNYVTFRDGNSCSANAGFSTGYITLSENSCKTLKTFMHEMLHATGMAHEQVRSDRERYLKINWKYIDPSAVSNFIKKDNIHDETFDAFSTLLYRLGGFTTNGVPTMELKDKEYEFLTRLTKMYSYYDIKELNTAYKCNEHCPSSLQCQNFGYVDQNCVCRCPAGLIGTDCQERDGNCGSTINLASGEVREITSPGWPNSYDVNKNCYWLIRAPASHRIKVRITDMDLAWNQEEDRCYHWLEMHLSLIGIPGLIRCGQLSGSTAEYIHSVNPEAGVLLMKFDSTYANDKPPATGFRLEVEAFKSGCISNPCLMGSTCIEGNNDFSFTCECVAGYSGPLCNQVTAVDTVTCDMERDFGDHCFLIDESYGWKIDNKHSVSGVFTYPSQGTMFGRPDASATELVSGVTFAEGNRCLSFDYVNNGGSSTGGFHVYYEANNVKTDIFSTNTNEGLDWKTVRTNILIKPGFKLTFEGTKKITRTTAIDNVMFAPGFCGDPCVIDNPCQNEGVCVPASNNLDFTCQCANGYLGQLCDKPGEHTTLRCDFEDDVPCFLTPVPASAVWTVKIGQTPSHYTGPDSAKSGYFYSYINAKNEVQNDYAVYKNEYPNLPKAKRCMTFYYHMRGTGMGTLKVTATGSNGFNQEIWNESGDHVSEWFKAIIDVPSVEELNIEIKGIVGPTSKSDIGIDDVVLRPGICGCESSPCQNGGICSDDPGLQSYTCACPLGYGGLNCDTRNYDPLNCDLESGEEDCFLKQDTTDNLEWIRHQGPTDTTDTGPSTAAGSGQYYYYMEGTYNNHKVARLYTNQMFKGDLCLKFNYHMYGLKMGSLEVKTNTKSLFLRGGDQLDQWHYAVVPVQEEQDLKVIFEGTIGPGWKSDIAIDNVILEPKACGCAANPCKNGGSCVDTSGGVTYNCLCTAGFSGPNCDIVGNGAPRCTLEDSDVDCFLIQDQTEGQNWIKHSGSTSTSYTGPSGAFGSGTYYYYMEASSVPENDVAMLRTTSTFQDMARCLELNYYMFGAGLGKLIIKANGANVFSVIGDKGKQWLTEKIEMPNPLYNITIEGVRGTTPKSDIGIDDIILHPQSCGMTKKRQLLLRELEKLEEELN